MTVVGYPESPVEYPPRRRCGGYYASLELAERAAELLEFDVVIPPRCRFGFYLVPAPAPETNEKETSDGTV